MSKYLIYLFISIGFITKVDGQLLSHHIRQAWSKDKHLTSKQFQLNQAEWALKEAKAMYGPNVGFNLQYTLAAGGRSIPFPIGDLLNPVYSTLNQMTMSDKFPMVENVEVNFLPNNFYDAKLSVQQPIYYPDLAINTAIKKDQISMQQLEIKAYKRMITKEVMNTCIDFAMTTELIKIYEESEKLLNEARRATISMIQNGIALPVALSNIDAQKAEILSKKMGIENDNKSSTLYFKYLTNDTIYQDDIWLFSGDPSLDPPSKEREEITQIRLGQEMLNKAVEKENKFYIPRIGCQLDFGSQAFNFGFTPYVILGFNLQMNIFDNKRHKMRGEIARLAIEEHQAKLTQINEQVNLQLQLAKNQLLTTLAQSKTFEPRKEDAAKNYKNVFTKYKEGTANYLELIQAQNLVINSSLQYNISKYTAWKKWSEFYYLSAAYPIND